MKRKKVLGISLVSVLFVIFSGAVTATVEEPRKVRGKPFAELWDAVLDLQEQINVLSGGVQSVTAGPGLVEEVSDGGVTLAVDFENLETSTGIRVQSNEDGIQIIAGSSVIVIEPSGNIFIESVGDLSLYAGGSLILEGQNVTIASANDLNVEAGSTLTTRASDTMLESGLSTDINVGSSQISVNPALLDLDAALIQLN
jgi:uncharacterized protein (DUF2345 family)